MKEIIQIREAIDEKCARITFIEKNVPIKKKRIRLMPACTDILPDPRIPINPVPLQDCNPFEEYEELEDQVRHCEVFYWKVAESEIEDAVQVIMEGLQK